MALAPGRTDRAPSSARSNGISRLDNVVGAAAYQAGRASRIAGVSARGYRLTIRLTRPSPTVPAGLATFGACAVPPDTPDRPRGLERIATAGPYYVAAVTPGKRIVLRRNPGYPGPASRGPKAIEVTIGTTPGRAIADVEAGRADFIPEVPPPRPGSADRALRAGQPRRESRQAAVLLGTIAGRVGLRVQPSASAVRPSRDAAGGELRDRPPRAGAAPNPGGAGGPADRPAHSAGLAGVPRRGDLPARWA